MPVDYGCEVMADSGPNIWLASSDGDIERVKEVRNGLLDMTTPCGFHEEYRGCRYRQIRSCCGHAAGRGSNLGITTGALRYPNTIHLTSHISLP